jgi:hypothetical protein
MSTLVTRAGKGSPLTHNEVDANFTNLNTDKVEKTSAAITGGTINGTTVGATTPAAGTFTTLTAQTEVLNGTGQNLVLWSADFSNAVWGGVTSNVTRTTTTINFTNASAYTYQQGISAVVGVAYTFSVTLSSTNKTAIAIRLAGSSTGAANQSLITLTSTPTRYSVTLVLASGNSAVDVGFDNRVAQGGDGSLGSITVSNAQLEIGSVVNAYVATTSARVYGTPTLSFSGVASVGLQSDGSLYATSAGTGNVRFYTNNIGQEQARVSHTASAVNYHQLTGSATGSGPIHSVAGSDTNIDLNLTTKGAGVVNLNTGSGAQARIIDIGDGTRPLQINGGSAAGAQIPGITATAVLAISGGGGNPVRFYTNGRVTTQQLEVAHTASAVNYVQVTGAATGGTPFFLMAGSDTNIGMVNATKGTGAFGFWTNSGANQQFGITHTASAVNRINVTGSATGIAPVLSALGSDTNIPLVLQPKGTGALQAQQTDSTATGGNARGANAVDWSTARATASQVANGAYANIAGGASNTSSGSYAVIGGGGGNINGGFFGTIAGGWNNSCNGLVASISGGYGNTANGYYNYIGAGFTNSGTSASAVTTQSGIMNATTAVTLSGSNANIKVGQYITGTSIAGDTYVAAISGTSLTLSKVASGSSTSTLSFYTPHGVVVGGGNNQATGSYSFIGGGGDAGTASARNTASGDWSFVGGGHANTSSQVGAVVCGGGAYGGGYSGNTSSGASSFVGAGIGQLATNNYTGIVSGVGHQANSQGSFVAGGYYGGTRGIDGNHVFPACTSPIAGTLGISQSALLVLGVQTTDATTTVLRSTSGAAGTTNQVILPNNSAYAFKGTVIANVTGGGNTKAWAIEGAIKRGANAASTALVGTPTVTSAYADAGASTWAITATADTTNGGLAITFTGQASTTIRCVAKLETVEVTF